MSSRGAMEGRIFAALREDGPMPRENAAQRATLDGDVKRALRIIKDLIEEERLVALSDGRLDFPPDRPRSALEAMVRYGRGRGETSPGAKA